MTYETLLLRQVGAVAHLRLNRPEKRNSLNRAFWQEFPAAIAALDASGATRALIISGEGPQFCAGIDIGLLAGDAAVGLDTPRGRHQFLRFGRALLAAFGALEQARFPVIAVVHGACVGAGLELAAACDLRFVTETAAMRIEEINIGIMADLGNLQRVPRAMPAAIARELAFTGATLTGARAAAIGFANGAYPTAEAAMEAAEAAAAAIAQRSPLAMAASKEMLAYAADHSLADALDRGMIVNAALLDSGDLRESIAARREARVPVFQDLPGRR